MEKIEMVDLKGQYKKIENQVNDSVLKTHVFRIFDLWEPGGNPFSERVT